MLLFWLISVLALLALALGFFVVRRNKKAILDRDRPDMPFFDLWQKNIKESILDDSIHSGIGVNRKLNK